MTVWLRDPSYWGDWNQDSSLFQEIEGIQKIEEEEMPHGKRIKLTFAYEREPEFVDPYRWNISVVAY
jgi:hypothetical protein